MHLLYRNRVLIWLGFSVSFFCCFLWCNEDKRPLIKITLEGVTSDILHLELIGQLDGKPAEVTPTLDESLEKF